METILVRYAELGLKSEKVRARFTKQLMDSITNNLMDAGIEHTVSSQRGRIFVDTANLDNTIDVLRGIPGIYSFSHVSPSQASFDDLMDSLADYARTRLEEGMSFGIKVKRTGETNYTSRDVAVKGGDAVCRHLDDSKVRVDLKNPDIWFEVEIRKDRAYLFTDRIKGMGGMPSSTQGKVLLYLPPVASLSGPSDEIRSRALLSRLMLIRRGCRVIPVIKKDDMKSWGDVVKELKEGGKDPFFLKEGDTVSGLKEAIKKTGSMGIVYSGREEDLGKYPGINDDGTPVAVFMPTIAFNREEVEVWLSRLNGS